MKVQQKIIEYVAKNPKSTGVEIMQSLKMRPKSASLYQVLKRMVRDGKLFRTANKKYVIAPNLPNIQYELPVSEKYKYIPKPKRPIGRPRKYPLPSELATPQNPINEPSPLEKIFLAEIDFVDSGIDSLMITKSYLQRRVEQLRADAKNKLQN